MAVLVDLAVTWAEEAKKLANEPKKLANESVPVCVALAAALSRAADALFLAATAKILGETVGGIGTQAHDFLQNGGDGARLLASSISSIPANLLWMIPLAKGSVLGDSPLRHVPPPEQLTAAVSFLGRAGNRIADVDLAIDVADNTAGILGGVSSFLAANQVAVTSGALAWLAVGLGNLKKLGKPVPDSLLRMAFDPDHAPADWQKPLQEVLDAIPGETKPSIADLVSTMGAGSAGKQGFLGRVRGGASMVHDSLYRAVADLVSTPYGQMFVQVCPYLLFAIGGISCSNDPADIHRLVESVARGDLINNPGQVLQAAWDGMPAMCYALGTMAKLGASMVEHMASLPPKQAATIAAEMTETIRDVTESLHGAMDTTLAHQVFLLKAKRLELEWRKQNSLISEEGYATAMCGMNDRMQNVSLVAAIMGKCAARELGLADPAASRKLSYSLLQGATMEADAMLQAMALRVMQQTMEANLHDTAASERAYVAQCGIPGGAPS